MASWRELKCVDQIKRFEPVGFTCLVHVDSEDTETERSSTNDFAITCWQEEVIYESFILPLKLRDLTSETEFLFHPCASIQASMASPQTGT
jgi:hypothetical protein